MADVWDGGTATVGLIKYEFNTDKSALRFSRTDLVPWPSTLGVLLTNTTIKYLREAYEGLEVMALRLDPVDAAFAATIRARAALYRTLAGTTPV